MGRETKILLGLLATLAGVLFGVLSMKLLVPRPPPGTGPDVAFDPSTAPVTELVEPPALAPRVPSPPPRPQVVADPTPPVEAAPLGPTAREPADAQDAMPRTSNPPPSATIAAAPRQDPFVKPATLEVGSVPSDGLPANALVAELPEPPPQSSPLPSAAPGASGLPSASTPPRAEAAATYYVARPGDSWWQVAERAYGDGRFYRALFAWNRVLDPRVSLTPGTRLEVPPRTRLEAAWPKLVPEGR